MKIERLELKAFGCFRDFTLDLSSSEQGMYLIYGVNETGKSTALHAIRQWLYEFDRNVALEFLYKKAKQRVGGELSCNGQRLCCFRKRGNANTLLDEADQPLGDDALRAFLQGIDEPRFRTIFGINHVGLREGGREIAAGKGDLGQALFAAGSGLLHLDRIQKRLTAAKEALFAVRGEKPVINSCLQRCEDLKVRRAQARLPLADIEEQQRTLAELKAGRQQGRTELTALEQKRDELDRLVRVTPLFRRREKLQQQLQDLGEATHLRGDFRADFERIDAALLKEQHALDTLQEQLTKVEAELTLIPPDPPVLDEQDALRKLAKEVGTYETDSQDKPGLQGQLNSIQGEAKQKLRALGREPDLSPAKIEPLRLDEQERNRIRDLGTKRAEFFANLDNCRAKVEDLELARRGLEEELETLPVPTETEALAATLKRITKKGDLEQEVADARRDLAQRERTLLKALARLPLWSGGVDQIVRAKVPSASVVDHHADHIETARRRQEAAANVVAGFRLQIVDLTNRRDRLRLTGEVPTEQDLEAHRSRRQRGWRLIRAAWLQGQGDPVAEHGWIDDVKAGATLAEAYEASVASSDQTADRLRREANRVSEQASLVADEAAAREKLATAERDVQQTEAALRAAEDAWKSTWREAGIEPHSPKEMRGWLDQWRELVQLANDGQAVADGLERVSSERDAGIRDLRSAFEVSGGLPRSLRPEAALGEWLDLAQARIDEAEELRRKRQTLEKDLLQVRRNLAKEHADLERAVQKKDEWEQQWETALRFLEPKQPLRPEEANRILDTLLEFWRKINDLKNRHSRIEGIDKRSGGFPQAIADLAERIEGKRPEGEEPLRIHERLQARWQTAESNQQLRRDKEEARTELQTKITGKEEAMGLLRQQLVRLCQEAGVEDPEQLPQAIRASEELREVDRQFQQCESDLQLQGGMADLETLCRLIAEAEAQQRDYAREYSSLQQQLQEKKAALEVVNQQIGAVEKGLQELRTRAGAGELAAAEESEHARLRDRVEEFATLALASRVLSEAISRYREGNSSGLLAEASTLFRGLTCSAFERLAIAEDEHSKPFLIGVRPDGSEVPVEGLSDGTCDQLYLSLRLAHLKRHVAKEGPFPLIVDDILLAFDNERARAALNCLADLGTCTQVLLFTHHRHIRDMGAAAEFSRRIAIRDLP